MLQKNQVFYSLIWTGKRHDVKFNKTVVAVSKWLFRGKKRVWGWSSMGPYSYFTGVIMNDFSSLPT